MKEKLLRSLPLTVLMLVYLLIRTYTDFSEKTYWIIFIVFFLTGLGLNGLCEKKFFK